jgi:hypothetical protein
VTKPSAGMKKEVANRGIKFMTTTHAHAREKKIIIM